MADELTHLKMRRDVRVLDVRDVRDVQEQKLLCQCQQDGDCPRYGRPMHGRDRDICRGVNVDLGEAAVIRAQWLTEKMVKDKPQNGDAVLPCPHRGEVLDKTRECGTCPGKVRQKLFPCNHPARRPEEVSLVDCRMCQYRPREKLGVQAFILKNHLSPGDVLIMSAAIYSLHRANPGKFVTAVNTTCDQVFEHNPDVVTQDDARNLNAKEVQTHYPLVNESDGRAVHVMQGYCDFLADALGVKVPLLTNRPMLYLSNEERGWLNQVEETTKKKGRFWLICAGHKQDYTCKFWGRKNYQEVVDRLRGRVQFVQVGATEHVHPPLNGVLNLVGKTDSRQLIRLAWHAEGAVGGVTFLQHIMAAHQKPYCCIMGGREPVIWNSYQKSQLFHTIGMLDCCRDRSCWRSRVVALGDGAEQDRSLCDHPTFGDEPVPQCMAMIRPEQVADIILKFS